MQRVASHYIFHRNEVYRMHYLELDDRLCVSGIYPFREEIAGTVFVAGIVFPVPQVGSYDATTLQERFLQLHREDGSAGWPVLLSRLLASSDAENTPIDLFRLSGVGLASPEFCANDGCGDCHIERL